MGRSRKPVYAQAYRGFESHSLRQSNKVHTGHISCTPAGLHDCERQALLKSRRRSQVRKITWTVSLIASYHDDPIFTESFMSMDNKIDSAQPAARGGIVPLIVGVVIYSVVLCVSYL